MFEVGSKEFHDRALLVALETPQQKRWEIEESLEELGELVKTAGGEVVDTAMQKLETPTAPFYIGKGKAEELAKFAKRNNVSSVVFDDDLTPAQSRNLEKLLSRKVIDRTQLILDIFAQRAKTREGKLQIELAQLHYLLPRLTRMWSHFSRQTGGIGTRGPGETQLEIDRRRVQERINRFEKELREVRKHRSTQRRARQRQNWPVCALVGYTNAGKSTLLNRLTQSEVYAADQLFATLDPTTRQLHLPNRQKALFTDTVGFIKKLPHHLVESFRATLEEVCYADVLLHVVDVSHPQYEQQIEAVNEVLKQIGASEKQTLMVYNKVDALEFRGGLDRLLDADPHAVGISAKSGEGMDMFLGELENMLRGWRLEMKLRIPQSEGNLISELHRVGRVLEKRYLDNDILIVAHIPPHVQGKFRAHMILDEYGEDSRVADRGQTAGAVVGTRG